MNITTFSFPTPIHFGVGARTPAAAHLLEAGRHRPLVVTDRAVATPWTTPGTLRSPAPSPASCRIHRLADGSGHRLASWPLQRLQPEQYAPQARAVRPPADGPGGALSNPDVQAAW